MVASNSVNLRRDNKDHEGHRKLFHMNDFLDPQTIVLKGQDPSSEPNEQEIQAMNISAFFNVGRKIFFWGDEITQHYADALHDNFHKHEDARIHFLSSVSLEGFVTCNARDASFRDCLELFLNTTINYNDVFIVGNFLGQHYGQVLNSISNEAALSEELSNIFDVVLQLFPGIILYHSQGPNRNAEESMNNRIQLLNNLVYQIIDNTRITYVDSYYFLTKYPKHEFATDGQHHPGVLSIEVLNQLGTALTLQDDPGYVFHRKRGMVRTDPDNQEGIPATIFLPSSDLTYYESQHQLSLFHGDRIACPDGWAQEYIDFHREALALLYANTKHAIDSLGIRVLVFKPHQQWNQGFADHIAGLERAFILAWCTRRLFFIDWEPVEDLFKRDIINWKFPKDVFDRLVDGHGDGYAIQYIHDRYQEPSVASYMHVLGFFPSDKTCSKPEQDILDTSSQPPLISLHSNRAASYETMQKSICGDCLKSIGLWEDNLFGCITQLLLQPSEDVLRPYWNVARAIVNTRRVIGIQARFGDHIFRSVGHGTEDEFLNLLMGRASCFHQLSAEGQEDAGMNPAHPIPVIRQDKYFLITDNMRLKDRALELYPTRFYVTAITPEHVVSNHTSATYAAVVAEWYLFSLATFHSIDPNSGIGRTSYAYAQSAHPTFSSRDTEGNCIPWRPKDLIHQGAFL